MEAYLGLNPVRQEQIDFSDIGGKISRNEDDGEVERLWDSDESFLNEYLEKVDKDEAINRPMKEKPCRTFDVDCEKDIWGSDDGFDQVDLMDIKEDNLQESNFCGSPVGNYFPKE